ncbi:MAG: hypothetical protein QXJ58_06820 [Archaeoglobaceae archaeon]
MDKLAQQNIDRLCADVGFSIPQIDLDKSKQKNVIQKALSVLSHDGIFAYLVWIESKSGKIGWDKSKRTLTRLNDDEKSSRYILLKSLVLLNNVIRLSPSVLKDLQDKEFEKKVFNGDVEENPDRAWDQIRDKFRQELTKPNGILEDIHQMFLVKQLFERMLTYALYRAKSLPEKSETR